MSRKNIFKFNMFYSFVQICRPKSTSTRNNMRMMALIQLKI